MKQDFLDLKKEFLKVKNMGLIKPLRKGTTGLGYTFETLIGKEEDRECKPDYKSIEIKCKLGYSKSDLNLFTSTPKKIDNMAVDYIFSHYSYYVYDNPKLYKMFFRKVMHNTDYELYGLKFILDVDYYSEKIIVKCIKNNKCIDEVCYWEFNDIKNKLYTKMQNLAIVKAYPYKKNNETFYKYLSINFYILNNFKMFLKLIESNDIYVLIYLREDANKLGDLIIKNHGFSFRIKESSFNKLFTRISV